MKHQIFSFEGKEIFLKNFVPSVLTPAMTQSELKQSVNMGEQECINLALIV